MDQLDAVRVKGEPEDYEEEEERTKEEAVRMTGGPEEYCQPSHTPFPPIGRLKARNSRLSNGKVGLTYFCVFLFFVSTFFTLLSVFLFNTNYFTVSTLKRDNY
jgi:hypothetical protein